MEESVRSKQPIGKEAEIKINKIDAKKLSINDDQGNVTYIFLKHEDKNCAILYSAKEQREELLRTLKVRFEKNMNCHEDLEWAKVQEKLEADTEKLWSLNEMEKTVASAVLVC